MPQNPNTVNATIIASYPTTVVQNVGTLAAAATLQTALAANPDRLGAVIGNPGTAEIAIFLGAAADGTVAKSVSLAVDAHVSLNTLLGPQATYTGAISVAGTKDQTYVTIEASKA